MCCLIKFNEIEWSFWDRIDVKGGLSLIQLLEYVRKELKLNVSMINHGLVTLYSNFADPEKIKKRYEMK